MRESEDGETLSKRSKLVVKLGDTFAPVPRWAALSPEFGRTEMAVLTYLLSVRDWDDETAFASIETMAESLACSVGTVSAGIKRLEALGMVVDRAQGECNIYELDPLYDRWRGWQKPPRDQSSVSGRLQLLRGEDPSTIEGYPSTIEGNPSTIGDIQEPSPEPSSDSSVEGPSRLRDAIEIVNGRKPRERDLLWEAFCEEHGDPATKAERGKFNGIVGKLREASVTPEEYPMLCRAYVHKNDLQPAPATVAERVGELRNYLRRGPIIPPSKREQAAAAARVRRQGWRDQ